MILFAKSKVSNTNQTSPKYLFSTRTPESLCVTVGRQQRQRRRGAGYETAPAEPTSLRDPQPDLRQRGLLLLVLVPGRVQQHQRTRQLDPPTQLGPGQAPAQGPIEPAAGSAPGGLPGGQHLRRLELLALVRAVVRQRRLLREQIRRRWLLLRGECFIMIRRWLIRRYREDAWLVDYSVGGRIVS